MIQRKYKFVISAVNKLRYPLCLLAGIFYLVLSLEYLYAKDIAPKGLSYQPIVVNGDNVEYSTETQEVIAQGNVEIIYEGSKLTCKKLTVNTQTKKGVAQGNARLEDEKGIIEGEKITYDFQTKTGTIIDAGFRSNPYFGKARKIERLGDSEFVARYGYFTTCSFDKPQYRIASKQISISPGDKIQTKHDTFFLGGFPLLYIPRFNHTIQDPLMHVTVMPGKSKDWGPYVLSAWRYSLTESANGRAYLDYRKKLGWAEGFGLNYSTTYLGKGDYKFYYTDENPDDLPATAKRTEFRRYLVRWRHKWDIGDQTNFISEFNKIGDQKRKYFDLESDILKDYFFREYEKDAHPLTYALFHHSFGYSSIDILMQQRVNNWYNQLDKLPEIKYSMPSLQLGSTPLYFENNSVFTSFNRSNSALPMTSASDISVARLDTTNKLSVPMKVAFLEFTPFVKDRQIAYDKDANGKSLPINTVFYAGADLSTKFYRIFNVKTNFLGLDLNVFRHVITPTIAYSYNHTPTINSCNLKQIDGVDAITRSNTAALTLSNKIQAKRKGVSVDLLDFRVTNSYNFKPQGVGDDKKGGSLSDFLFNLKLLPYSWMRVEADATYQHSGASTGDNYNHFSQANYDINFDFARGSFGIGQRYARKGQNQMTLSFNWKLSPKWKFVMYQRYNVKPYIDSNGAFVRQGSLEQQYTLTRDLHCWEVDITGTSKRNYGSGLFIVFRLKAFPESELMLINQAYSAPKSGAQ